MTFRNTGLTGTVDADLLGHKLMVSNTAIHKLTKAAVLKFPILHASSVRHKLKVKSRIQTNVKLHAQAMVSDGEVPTLFRGLDRVHGACVE